MYRLALVIAHKVRVTVRPPQPIPDRSRIRPPCPRQLCGRHGLGLTRHLIRQGHPFAGAHVPGAMMEAGGAEKLAEDVLAVAVSDARSANGYRAAARWWLTSSTSDYWMDLLGVDRGFVRERMAAEGVL